MTTLFVLAIVAARQHRPRVGGNDRHRPQIWATCRRSLGDPAANAMAGQGLIDHHECQHRT